VRHRIQEADVSAAVSFVSSPAPSLGRHGQTRSHHAARGLLEQARQGLVDAEYASRPVDRYTRAHLAALRGAAAVLAARARPRRRARPTSAWTLLRSVAPELAEWSEFFAATSSTRAAAEAGVVRLVTTRDADDMIRQAGQFLGLVERALARNSR
jgi:hypothetical protein